MRLRQSVALSILLWGSMLLSARADEVAGTSVGLGITGGYSRVTFFRGSGVEGIGKLRSRNSFAFGITSQYGLYATDWVQYGIQPELLYARRGVRVEYAGDSSGYQIEYIEFPVLGRILLMTSGSVEPYIVIGPRFGLLLSAERTDANGSVRDESDGTNTLDVGFSSGVGVQFQVGSRMMLSLEGRYDQSLMNRIDDSVDTTADQRHRAFFLMLGVSMGLGSPSRPAEP